MFLRQSTAVVLTFGPFLDKTDGVTLKTGLVSALDHASTGILLTKNGGTLTIRHATVTASTYDAHGCYKVTLDTTDTGTLGLLRMIYTDAATCLPVWRDLVVITQNEWDSMMATAIRAANATQLAGQAITAAAGVTFPSSVASPTNITAGTITTATNLTNAPTAGDLTATMKASVTTAASAATPAVTVSDKTGFSLSVAGILAIWHQLVNAIATAGSIGKLLVDNITGDAFSRLGAPAGASIAADVAAVKTETASIQADTNDIQGRIPAALVSGRIDSNVGAYPGNTVQTGDAYARLGAPAGASLAADVAALPAAVWAAGTRTLTSFGSLVADAVAGVWAAGARTVTAFGFTVATTADADIASIKGKTDNLPASPAATGAQMDLVAAPNATAVTALQSGLATGSAVATVASYIDTEIAAIKAKTDLIPAEPAALADIPTADQVATAVLDLADGIEAGITLRQGQRVQLAAAAGLLDGAATDTIHLRNQADTKNRITATVDENGNRTGVVLDLS